MGAVSRRECPRWGGLLGLVLGLFVVVSSRDVRAACGDGIVGPGEQCDGGLFGAPTWVGELPSTPLGGLFAWGEGALFSVGDEVRSLLAQGPSSPVVAFPGGDLRQLVVDVDGIVFVAARATNRIERFVGSGITLGAYPLGGALFSPEALAIRGSFLYVVSARTSLGELRPVVRVSRHDGTHLGTFGDAVGERGVALFEDGTLLTIDGSTLTRYDATGAAAGVFASFAGPVSGVWVAADATVFARVASGDGEVLVRLTRDGVVMGSLQEAELDGTWSVSGPFAIDGGRLMFSASAGGTGALMVLDGHASDHRPDACRLDCQAPACGDGVRDEGESCDDGGLVLGDGCAACEVEVGFVCLTRLTAPDVCQETCGDGGLDPGEGCDDGDLEAGDGCTPVCTVEAGWRCADGVCEALVCGDGLAAGLEECDDGAQVEVGGDGCHECMIEAGWACDGSGCRQTCGDGVLAVGEQCDDGGLVAGDGCSPGCRAEVGWTCDGGGCVPICGDGRVLGDEACELAAPGCIGCQVAPGWVCDEEACFQTCGDGELDELEGCDDGNTTAGDGCGASCTVELGWVCEGSVESVCVAAACGDGRVAGAEQCDDADTESGDGCSANCGLEAGWVCDLAGCRNTCGNGVLDLGEACDDGTVSGGDGCDPSCRLERGWSCPLVGGACTAARCGDGFVAGLEACDDGNEASGDGCLACRVEAGWVCDLSGCRQTCGNGVLEAGEGCDDGNLRGGDGCDAACSGELGWVCLPLPIGCETVCGDLVIAGAETCEDGNEITDDGCDGCVLTAGWVCPPPSRDAEGGCRETCGDGVLDEFEACDLGDLESGDGCSPGCVIEPGFVCDEDRCVSVCGDARIAGDETCDDANAEPFDGCDACRIERGFVCPDGGGDPVLAGCQETCGDDVLDPLEACDDGDLSTGDGCDANCRVEVGWACVGDPSVCDAARCGDGIVAGFEACDDGNEDSGDGCSASCSAELGFVCGPSGCVAVCGDARTLGAEACDDGNQLSSDGCTACGVEAGWTCSAQPGGRSTCVPSEVCGDGRRGGTEGCDDGNDEPDDGCDGCLVEPGWACVGNACEQLDDDGDGLSNLEEARWLTRPDDPDTDRDGLEDGDEVVRGTDPRRRDTDNDGLDDGLEVLLGLDPRQADSDFDGVIDGEDNCPGIRNPDQRDADRDGIGTVCDGEEIPRGVLDGGGCGAFGGGGLWAVIGLGGVLVWGRRRAPKGWC